MSDGSKYIPTILVGRVLTTRAYFLLKAGQFAQAFKRGHLPNVLFPAFQFKSFLDLAHMEFSQRLFTQTAPCVDLSYAEVAGRVGGVSIFPKSLVPQAGDLGLRSGLPY